MYKDTSGVEKDVKESVQGKERKMATEGNKRMSPDEEAQEDHRETQKGLRRIHLSYVVCERISTTQNTSS